MKRVCATLYCCLIFASSALLAQTDSSKATAQTDSSSGPLIRINEAALTGGISLPYLPAETRNFLKTGWNAGIVVGMSFDPGSMGYGALELSAEYNRFAFNYLAFHDTLLKTTTGKNLSVSRNPTRSFAWMLNFRGTFASSKQSIAPFFLLGAGMMSFTAGSVHVDGDTAFTAEGFSRLAFVWTAGIGVEVPITSSFDIFFEGRSVLGVLDQPRQYFPISAGIRFRRE